MANLNKVINYLLEERGVENILEAHQLKDCVDVICEIGGDVIHYRVYGDEQAGYTLGEK